MIHVYPNPSDGLINFESGGLITDPVTVKIMDFSGRILYSNPALSPDKVLSLDLSEYPAGIYILEMRSKGSLFTQKLILE
jgi:hypothetical protein